MKLFKKAPREETPASGTKPKKKLFKKFPKKLVAIVLVVAVVGGVAAQQFFKSKDTGEDNWNYVKAEKRDISVVLSGSGTVKPNDQYNVTSSVKGDILECTFKEGDSVKKGQLLYKIDPSEAQNSISKSELSVEKSKLSYNESLENQKNLSVTSDKTGVVTKVYVSEGDDIQNGAKIADLQDSSYMLLEIPFNAKDVSSFWVGQNAAVTLDGSFETVSGTVSEISGSETVLDGYQIVRKVTIKVKNPGGLSTTSYASATIGGKACNSGANFTYNAETTISAKTAGTIKSLLIKEGSKINQGDTVARLSSTAVSNSIKSEALNIKDSQLSLENLYDNLGDYNITAPISGTVITKTSKVGDKLDNTNGATAMAVIYDMSKLTFDMSIDELDVSKLEVGQEVSITADAIENEEFKGHVEKISVSGKSENGVTSYPVTVAIDNPSEKLLPGMNVNADIVVQSQKDVLCVPVAAVNRGNTVYVDSNTETAKNAKPVDVEKSSNPAVKANSTAVAGNSKKRNSKAKSSSGTKTVGSAPDGYTPVTVTIGMNDNNYIEIKSGLTEGDTVAVAVLKSSGSDSIFSQGGGGEGGPPPE